MKPSAHQIKQKRRRAFKKGIWSETLATVALRLSGHRILARRFRCRSGEIDIIASKRDLIVFVEVKARTSLKDAVDSVGFHNQNRIRNAADYWISKQNHLTSFSYRFDIVAVAPLQWPVHVKDAF